MIFNRRLMLCPLSCRIIAMAMMIALTACSLATVAYNNAGVLIGYALDDYVDLTPRQEAWLKGRVGILIAWHRSNELPDWQRWLTETREHATGSPQASDVRSTYASGRALLARTTDQLLPDLAQLLRQLEAPQLAHLEIKFARDNRKIAEEIARPLPRRQASRVERMRDRFESWLGSLTAEQDAYLQVRISALLPLDEMRLADRQRWQRQFIELVKARPELPALQVELRNMILAPEIFRDPAYQAELARQQEEMMALTAWMVTNATPSQRKHLQKKLAGYAEDITRLLRV